MAISDPNKNLYSGSLVSKIKQIIYVSLLKGDRFSKPFLVRLRVIKMVKGYAFCKFGGNRLKTFSLRRCIQTGIRLRPLF